MWGNSPCCTVMLYLGKGLKGSNGACSTLCRISITPSATHNQIGPLWCWFPSGWACACSRPLRVSPTTSPVRLGVPPAAAPTPTGVFNQRFEALFPCVGALGHVACFAPLADLSRLSVCDYGAAGSARGRTACPILPHSTSLSPTSPTLHQSGSRHKEQPESFLPGCPSPPLLPVWMNVSFFNLLGCFTSLLFNFLSILVV